VLRLLREVGQTHSQAGGGTFLASPTPVCQEGQVGLTHSRVGGGTFPPTPTVPSPAPTREPTLEEEAAMCLQVSWSNLGIDRALEMMSDKCRKAHYIKHCKCV